MTKRKRPGQIDHVRESHFTSNMGSEDMAWPEANSEELLDAHGYEPDHPLELLLRALIEAHVDDDERSDDERLEIALSALLGRKRRPGMKESDDYSALLTLGRAYFAEFIATGTYPDIAPIIRTELRDWIAHRVKKDGATEESIIRRLRLKFIDKRDLLLVRITNENDYSSRDTLRAVGEIADRMRALGIEISHPRRRTEPKPGQ